MDVPDSRNIDSKLCKLCLSCPQKYTCPRCSVPYCSMECYKSTLHLDCSEEFYKECVENEMKTQSNDPEVRKKMIDILKRFHSESSPDDVFNDNSVNEDTSNYHDTSDASIDSDDDNEVPDLAKRIESIDLNNADDLWMVLTDAEKQEFEAIIRNGEEEILLPQWTPWWSKRIENKLVQIINENENTDYKEYCPHIVKIAAINAVEKASPLMCYNFLNILNAYAFMALHYNGEHESLAMEAIAFFLQLSDVIRSNAIFKDSPSAISSISKKAIEYELIPENSKRTTILNAVKQIIQGPCEEHRTFYMAAALSDLHQLFTKATSQYNSRKRNLNSTFPIKLKSDIESGYSNLTKKRIQLYVKKVEYYMAWNDKYGECMHELNLN